MNTILKLKELLEFLTQKLKGTLDGKPFEAVSIRGVGAKKFCIKGWVSTSDGPMVKFSCPWGELSDGQVYYQPTPQDKKQETEETGIDLDVKKLTLVFETEDGQDHTAVFEVI